MPLIKHLMNHLSQAGDTIVEVMIVLSVLGLALSISYATANRSLVNTRQAEENAQATRYVQTQIEAIRELAKANTYNCPSRSSTTNVFCQATRFCLPSTADSTTPIHHPFCDEGSQSYQIADFYCNNSRPTYAYNLNATPCDSTMTADTFVVETTWADAGGDGTDSVTQVYRVHPGE